MSDLDQVLLAALADTAEHTTALAFEVDRPLSTVRRHLEAMLADGRVVGIKHDERNTGGRIRVYWSLPQERRA